MKKFKTLMKTDITPVALGKIASCAVGTILVFSGVGKLVVSPDMEHLFFASVVGAGGVEVLLKVLPVIEILLGVLLIARYRVNVVAPAAIALVLVFIINNVWIIATQNIKVSCGQCLGWGIDSWPPASLFIDMIMVFLLVLGMYAKKINMGAKVGINYGQ